MIRSGESCCVAIETGFVGRFSDRRGIFPKLCLDCHSRRGPSAGCGTGTRDVGGDEWSLEGPALGRVISCRTDGQSEQRRSSLTLSRRAQRTMIVAMTAVRMMKMPIDQVVHMIPMRHSFMAASRSMHMCMGVTAATVLGCAPVGIGW